MPFQIRAGRDSRADLGAAAWRGGADPVSGVVPAVQRGLVRDFKNAWEAKDIGALVGILDPGATIVTDGGGLVAAAVAPIEGSEQIAQGLIKIAGVVSRQTILERTVNGQPGLVAQQDGVTVTVFAFEVADGRIKHIWAVRNPNKLRPWAVG